jgi:hypothetical protein
MIDYVATFIFFFAVIDPIAMHRTYPATESASLVYT